MEILDVAKKYTVTMILLFAGIVTTQQYFGSPITCWVPAQFTGSYEKYANDICWIMNTYYVPMDHDIPHADTTRYERMLKYYQWSPLILLFMALCFYFPHMVWRSLNDKSGLDIEKLVKQAMGEEKKEDASAESKDSPAESKKPATESKNLSAEPDNPSTEPKTSSTKPTDPSTKSTDSPTKPKDPPAEPKDTRTDREKAIDYICKSIQEYVENRYATSGSRLNHPNSVPRKIWYYFAFWRHRHLSAYIVLLFTFVKLLFVINSLVQIFLLNAFLGNEYHLFGIEVVSKFIQGLDWGESKRFPRVTLCDFHIREVGIVHRYTVQCVLPINLFNEKIFLILWFWIILLAAFNICDFIAWLFRIIRVDSRSDYVVRKLKMGTIPVRVPRDPEEQEKIASVEQRKLDPAAIHHFVRNYLQEDGCFALRLLARNGQDMIVGDVINQLFVRYCELNPDQRLNADQSINHSNGLPQHAPRRNVDHSFDHSNNVPQQPPPRSRTSFHRSSFEPSPNDEEQQNFV